MTTLVTPGIKAFRTRRDLGLAAPRSVSHDIDTNPGGAAAHYGGAPAAVSSHAVCEQRWRAWQEMHMAQPRGWNDIAYTGGFCSHGYALAGRGHGVRTAAQGTNDGNDRYHAYVWINDRATPTIEALAALGWWIEQGRAFGAGLDVRSHRTFHSTDCAGDPLTQYAAAVNGRRIVVGDRPPPPGPGTVDTGVAVATQRAVHVTADGHWGPQTDAAVRAVRELRAGHPTAAEIRAAQRACGAVVDGVWGPASKLAHVRTVKALQLAWRPLVPGLGVDGIWGPGTNDAWGTVRNRLNGK